MERGTDRDRQGISAVLADGDPGPLVDAIPDPVCVLDTENRFEAVNEAMVACTGYEREELLGRALGEIVPAGDYDPLTDRLESVADDWREDRRESATVETSIITDDGDLIVTEAHVTALTDEHGTDAGTVAVLRDIRERKRRERNLELLKQVLTRVFRHNVRNELMVAKMRAEFIQDQADEDLRDHTEKIQASAETLLDHSEKARRIEAVIESAELHDLDIVSTVEAIVADAREAHPNASIDVDIPAEWRVQAHSQVDSAVEELIENAIEHAPDGRQPRVRIWCDQRSESQTLFIEDESGGLGGHEISVLRKGDEDDLEHSSGVGLWLVRWVVEYSDAEMIVHRTNQGTLMGIRFGESAQAYDSQSPAIEESPLRGAPEHVRDRSPERFEGEPVIGRGETLDKLDAVYRGLERKGGHSVMITGPAGIGKTTLLDQFRERLDRKSDAPIVATGECDSALQPPYHAFREVLAGLPGERDMSELLADAASLSVADADELDQRKRALFAEIADELRAVSSERPVVLVVEDMQWADRGTINLFEYLIDAVGRWSYPVLFVGTFRTGDVERSHPVLEVVGETADTGRGTVLRLDPFDTTDVRSLVAHVLDIEEMPSSFVDAIYDHTGGTPLFVNELVRHLAETLSPVRERADLPADLDAIPVPDTVERAIADRLGALPEDVRPVLETGAVIGTDFSFDVLRAATDQSTETLIESIETLARRHIWTRSANRIEFVHGVVREQTLEAIEDEARIHERVASAIERVYPDAHEEYAARLATHYEQAGDHGTAYEYYREAGHSAAETYAHEDAIDYYERALSLAEDPLDVETDPAGVAGELGDVYELLGAYETASEYYERSLSIARETDDRECEATSLANLGRIAQNRGAYDRAEEYYEQSLDIAQTAGNRPCEATSLLGLGNVRRIRGAYEQARDYYERSLDLCRDIEDRHCEAQTLQYLGEVAWNQGRHDRARECHEQSLSIRQEIGDRSGEAESLQNLGNIADREGNYDQARDYYERSLSIRQEISDRNGEAESRMSLGIVAFRRGVYDRAREYYSGSLDIFQEIGRRRAEAVTLHNLGYIAQIRGAYDRAQEYYEDSLAIKRDLGDRNGEAESLHNLGYIAENRGASVRAREYYERALELREEIGDRNGEAESLNGVGRIELQTGGTDAAREAFTTALDIAREINAVEPEVVGLRELGRLERRDGDYEQAREFLDESLAVCEDGENHRASVKTQLERARLALSRGALASADEIAEGVRDTLAELDAPHHEAWVERLQGRIAAADGAPQAARSHWRDALTTFEDIGAPQDALATLQLLVETCRQQGETETAEAWRETAAEIAGRAPDSVERDYEGWIENYRS